MSKTKKMRPTEEAYTELQHAYDCYNDHLFEGALPACMITFQREKRTMGYFSANRFVKRVDGTQTDEIALNPEYFALYPMIEVLQTLVHEMTHLWQRHFGTPSRSCYHNNEWADKLENLGLMPSDTGAPGGKRTGQKIADYSIPGGRFERVTKDLLADGFAISWLDRFPVQQLRPPSALPIAYPAALSSPDGDVCVASELDPHEVLFAAAFATPAQMQPALELEIRSHENRSNRDKYTCPSCTISVWGRPKLRVKCADCDALLLPADA